MRFGLITESLFSVPRPHALLLQRISRTLCTMTSSDTHSLGYPDCTFRTELLPCDADASVTFQEAGPSRYGGAEPLTSAEPHIASSVTRDSLAVAARHLHSGQLVSFPSETVYGLGANALSQSAAAKIYAAKKRPADNPLIVHVADLEMLDSLLPPSYTMSAAYSALIKAFWPGALTLLFPVDPQRPAVPSVVTCGQPSVAVRMPSHPIARALIATSRLPMAGPSANASGRPSPTTAAHVMRDLGGQLDTNEAEPRGRLQYILDGGACTVGVESTVVDGLSADDEVRVLRPGGVTVEQIAQVLNEARLDTKLRVYGKDMERSAQQESNPTTPGMKYRHYSPTARVVMLLPATLFARAVTSSQPTASARVVDSLIDSPPAAPRSFAHIIHDQLSTLVTGPAGSTINVGVMTSSDSNLARLISSASEPAPPTDTDVHPHLLTPLELSELPGVLVHRFDLGPSAQPSVYAQRMFDGLRTLDEGPLHGADKCELIFVEALDDSGVGLAVMNRLKKAASATVVLDC